MASRNESKRRPLVAIIGRPNVGKSSLFNRMVGDRRAIVEPTPGVTRDRLVLPVKLPDFDLEFDLMDTGGIGIVDRADLAESVEAQVLTGMYGADLLLFLVDSREGLALLDQHVTALVRRSDRPVLLAANKSEGREARANITEFAELGLGEPQAISALNGQGLGALYESMQAVLPPSGEVAPVETDALRIAVLGRRNTGKSSYINALVGSDRVIVSEIPGTTRDAVDVEFSWGSRPVVLVDTAGIHRRGKIANAVEFFSLTRSDTAIRRADVGLLFLDLADPIARLDQELARRLADRYKPVVVVGTKSDLEPDLTLKAFQERLDHKLPHLRGAPACLVSNTERRGLQRPMDLAFALQEEASRRIGTAKLNQVLSEGFARISFRGRSEKPKAYYATQLRVSPPTFLLFVNKPDLFTKEGLRAVANFLRRRLELNRIPIRIVLRERPRSPSKGSIGP